MQIGRLSAPILHHKIFQRKKIYIIQENQTHIALYFVADGLLKSSFLGPSGKEHIIQFATEYWWISDFQAFFRQVLATLSFQCLQDATLYCIHLQDFEKIFREIPKVEHFFRLKANNGYIKILAHPNILKPKKFVIKGAYQLLMGLKINVSY